MASIWALNHLSLFIAGVSIFLWRRSGSDPSGQAKQVGGGVEQEGEAENAVDQRGLLLAQGLHPQCPLRHKTEQGRHLHCYVNTLTLSISDQNAASGDVLHRLPDKRAEERRSKQWGRRFQSGHSQEVERENGGAEAEGAGKRKKKFKNQISLPSCC